MLKRVLVPVITLAVVIGGILFARSLMATSSQADPNQYRFAEAKSDLVKKTVSATGVLTAWTNVDIKSRAGGKVVSLPVEEGTVVHKGQLIAEIDPSDTLLTVNQAKADIASSEAKVVETRKVMTLQQSESQVAIDTAQANLHAAQASANAALARWESAKSDADSQDGLTDAAIANAKATLVAEQQKLAQMSSASHPQERAIALADLHQAEANLKNADAQLRRQQALLAKGFVPQAQVDTAEATREVAFATLQSTREKVDTLNPQQDTDLQAEQARVDQCAAALRTAEANRVQIKLKRQAANAAHADYLQAVAAVKQAEVKVVQARAERMNDAIKDTEIAQAKAAGARSDAALVNANIQLKDTHVAAPSDGIILKKYVEQGTMITSGMSFNSTGTSIVNLGDISRMYVDVQVDETDVASVTMDQKVDITFDAYPTTPFEGKVIKIEPQAVIDSNVTTVHVRVEVDNSTITYRLLKPGMNSTCEFIVDKKDDVLCVPNEAVKTDTDGSSYVQIAEGGKVAPGDKDTPADPNVLIGIKIVKRPVKVGLAGNETTEILEGVKPGDRVITQTIEPAALTAGSGNMFGGGKGPGKK
jgi:HlyD family secretion protein